MRRGGGSITPYRRFKSDVYEQIAVMGQALANPHRLELLDLLSQAPKSVDRLAAESGLTVTNASQHLQVLKRAHLVSADKQGTRVVYRLADEAVPEVLRALRSSAERYLPELDHVSRRFLNGRAGMLAVDREQLRQRVLAGDVVVLDVRPNDEFEAGHIPGARSVPLAELEERLAHLPTDREIVAYCRGPYCVLAVEAVERLRARGFHAVRLEDGVIDWKSLGLPVSVGPDAAQAR